MVGLFIFYKFERLNKIINFGFYRGDGLAVDNNMGGPQLQKFKNKLQVLFKEFGLNLVMNVRRQLSIN